MCFLKYLVFHVFSCCLKARTRSTGRDARPAGPTSAAQPPGRQAGSLPKGLPFHDMPLRRPCGQVGFHRRGNRPKERERVAQAKTFRLFCSPPFPSLCPALPAVAPYLAPSSLVPCPSRALPATLWDKTLPKSGTPRDPLGRVTAQVGHRPCPSRSHTLRSPSLPFPKFHTPAATSRPAFA